MCFFLHVFVVVVIAAMHCGIYWNNISQELTFVVVPTKVCNKKRKYLWISKVHELKREKLFQCTKRCTNKFYYPPLFTVSPFKEKLEVLFISFLSSFLVVVDFVLWKSILWLMKFLYSQRYNLLSCKCG